MQLNSAIKSILFCFFRTYYQCQANGAKRGGYEAILKHCAAGTAFDPKSGICNHVSSLSCEKEPSQSVDPFELSLRGMSSHNYYYSIIYILSFDPKKYPYVSK
jgi:hypothetical protein